MIPPMRLHRPPQSIELPFWSVGFDQSLDATRSTAQPMADYNARTPLPHLRLAKDSWDGMGDTS